MDAGHIPVLLHECIDNLNIRPDGIYVDGTLGMGGHSEQIAGRLTTGTLIGIDRDETAIARAGARPPFSTVSASTPWTACSLTSAFPRRSSTRRSAAFRICTTRRSICAWTRPAA